VNVNDTVHGCRSDKD